MGMFDKFVTSAKARFNAILDSIENTNENLDLAYENLLELMKTSKGDLVSIVASINEMEASKRGLILKAEKFGENAKSYLDAGKEDLAREAMKGKLNLEAQIVSLDNDISGVKKSADALTKQIEGIALQIQTTRARKETLKAQTSAANARLKINEAVTDIGTEMASIGEAIERSKEKIAQKTARADAIDGLVADGTLTNAVEVDSNVSELDVDQALAALKTEKK